jgi:hypothetical protein
MTLITPDARIVTAGPLPAICRAINRAVRDQDGKTGYCILAAASTMDLLRALGWPSNVLRDEAMVCRGGPCEPAVILGGRRIRGSGPSAPGMWSGHLVAIADGRYLVDPTIDQVESGGCPLW